MVLRGGIANLIHFALTVGVRDVIENVHQKPGKNHHLKCRPAIESDFVSQLSANSTAQHTDINVISLDHHVFSQGEWKRAHLRDHPKVQITTAVDKSPWWYKKSDRLATISHIDATITATADSRAQSDLWSPDEYLAHGFSREDLAPVKMAFSAANRSPIPIEGAFFSTIRTQPASGMQKMCHSMVYT